jgi:hypothetical protein
MHQKLQVEASLAIPAISPYPSTGRVVAMIKADTVQETYERMKAKLSRVVPDVELREKAALVFEINRLKEERGAIILGHNYMEPALYHTVPDVVGRLARALATRGPDGPRSHRLLRRALHGRDGQDLEPIEDRPLAGREGGLFARGQYHRGGCARAQATIPRRSRGHVRQLLRGREGGDRRVLHVE